MSDKEDIQAESSAEVAQQPQSMQVNIKMQQGEHAGQPIYSNFTAVQSGSGAVIVDFGFLDPQTINALNRMAQSGEKKQTVNARMSCRMAISVETASQLSRQLNQLLHSHSKADASRVEKQNNIKATETGSDTESENKSSSSGKFRLPWSSDDKSH